MDKRSLGVGEDTRVKPHVLDTGSNPVLTTIVSVMATHEKLRYNARYK